MDLLSELLEDSNKDSALYLKASCCAQLYATAVNVACLLGVPLSWIRVEFWGCARRVGYTYHSGVLFYDGTTWKHETRTRYSYTADTAECFLLYPDEECSEVPAEANKVPNEPYYKLVVGDLVYRDGRGNRITPYVKEVYPPKERKKRKRFTALKDLPKTT